MTYEYMKTNSGLGTLPGNYLGSGDGQILVDAQLMAAKREAEGAVAELQSQLLPTQQLQPIAEQQPGWLTEEEAAADAAAHGRSEARDMIQAFTSLVERARSGDQGAMQELQDAVNHHDTQESIAGCRQLAAGTLETPPIDRDLYTEYCGAMNLAIQVAEGNDPQQQRNVMIAVGVGGALAAAGLGYYLWRRRR